MQDKLQKKTYKILRYGNGRVIYGSVTEVDADFKLQAAEIACGKIVRRYGRTSEICAKVWVSRSTTPSPEYFYAQ